MKKIEKIIFKKKINEKLIRKNQKNIINNKKLKKKHYF